MHFFEIDKLNFYFSAAILISIVFYYSYKEMSKEIEECPICLERLTSKNLSITKCNHKYHTECLLKTKYRCPLCNDKLILTEYEKMEKIKLEKLKKYEKEISDQKYYNDFLFEIESYVPFFEF